MRLAGPWQLFLSENRSKSSQIFNTRILTILLNIYFIIFLVARFITTAGVLTGFGVHASDMFDVAAEIVVSGVPAAA